MSELQSYWDAQPLVTNGSTKPRVNGKATSRKSKRMHNYRLIDPRDLRGVPLTSGEQADNPRKRHKLASKYINPPRDRTIALTDTLVTRADGSQYWIPRTSRSVSRKETQRRTLDTIDLQNKLDERRVRKANEIGINLQNYSEDN